MPLTEHAAYQQAKDNFRSTVIDHFHSPAGVRWWANPEFRVFGLWVSGGGVIGGRQAYFEPRLRRSR